MNQNFNGYYLFFRVAEAGNISRASELLYISQPAVSKAVTKLEEQLGTQLFIRTPKGVELTSDGKKLYIKLKSAFTTIEAGEKELRENIKSSKGKIRIGASAVLCRSILVPYLEKFISKYPKIQTSIVCQSSADTVSLLEKGEIDIGLVAKPSESNGLEYIEVAPLEYIFVSSKAYIDSIDKTGKKSSEKIISDGNILLLDEHNSSRVYIDNYLMENNISLAKITEISGMDLLIDFAKIGLGISCVIKKFVEDDLKNQKLVELKLKKPAVSRTAVFAYRSTCADERCIKAFLSTL